MRAIPSRSSPRPTRPCTGRRPRAEPPMDAFFPNGWMHYLAGGLLLGAGMSLLFAATGLVGGMSTVFTTVWSFVSRAPYFNAPRFLSSRAWRLVYAAGLVLGAAAWMVSMGAPEHTGVP